MPAIFTATSGDDVTVTCTTRDVALTGEATATSNNMSRAIAIDGISAMLALQPIGRWTRRAPRKAQSRCSGPRDGGFGAQCDPTI